MNNNLEQLKNKINYLETNDIQKNEKLNILAKNK